MFLVLWKTAIGLGKEDSQALAGHPSMVVQNPIVCDDQCRTNERTRLR